jgi:hypothetical protein
MVTMLSQFGFTHYPRSEKGKNFDLKNKVVFTASSRSRHLFTYSVRRVSSTSVLNVSRASVSDNGEQLYESRNCAIGYCKAQACLLQYREAYTQRVVDIMKPYVQNINKSIGGHIGRKFSVRVTCNHDIRLRIQPKLKLSIKLYLHTINAINL